MVSDDLHALSVHQTHVLTAVLSDLGLPLGVSLTSINDDELHFKLFASEQQVLSSSSLRTLVCDLADALDVYRVDVVSIDEGEEAFVGAYRYHARKKTKVPSSSSVTPTMADLELVVARLLTERHGNRSPSWLAGQLRVSWKAAERILAELDDAHAPAPT